MEITKALKSVHYKVMVYFHQIELLHMNLNYKQGDSLSPILFNVVMERILNKALKKKQCLQTVVQEFYSTLNRCISYKYFIARILISEKSE